MSEEGRIQLEQGEKEEIELIKNEHEKLEQAAEELHQELFKVVEAQQEWWEKIEEKYGLKDKIVEVDEESGELIVKRDMTEDEKKAREFTESLMNIANFLDEMEGD